MVQSEHTFGGDEMKHTLKSVRVATGYSLEELSQGLGFPVDEIINFENMDFTELSLEVAIRFTKFYQISLDEMED